MFKEAEIEANKSYFSRSATPDHQNVSLKIANGYLYPVTVFRRVIARNSDLPG